MSGRSRVSVLGAVVALVLAWWQPSTLGQQSGATAPASVRAAAARGQSVRVIVGVRADDYRPEGILAPAARAGQRAALQELSQRVLGRLPAAARVRARVFDAIPSFSPEADANTLLQLESDPDVVSIEEDRLNTVSLAQSVPLIGGSDAWASGFTGAGWTVAILDTGVEQGHSFLAGKTVAEGCYSNANTSGSPSLCPGGVGSTTGPGSGLNCSSAISASCFHGTHVAGIAAGRGASFSGVAKDANIMAFQVFTNGGGGSIGAYTSDIIAAMNRVYALRGSYNIASVNMSLGGSIAYTNQSQCDTDNGSFKSAIDLLRSVNIASVIASGNDSSPTGISSPGCISSAVSVGSTTKSDVVSSFSNAAPFLSLLAPGSSINSSMPGNTFGPASGTSMATPHVAGAWAVLRQRRPSATVTEVLNALKSTGTPITDTRPGSGLTFPRIRVNVALTALTTPLLTVDNPGAGSTKTLPFPVNGWAIDRNALTGTGIDQVHVYAFPAGGGGPIAIGVATYGASRPDVGAAFGSQFINSGWSITANGLPNGNYTIVAYGHSTVTGTFNVQGSVAITVSGPIPNPAMSLDRPLGNGSSGTNVTVSGWAIDLGTPSGTGVDQVHVYAFPTGGGSPIGVVAAYGLSRPDVGAVFGGQFTNSGFQVVMNGVPAGTYNFTAYMHSTVSGTFILTATATNVTVNATTSNPQMYIDTAAGSYGRPFTISGWAVDAGAMSGPGIDAIHVWAFPVGGAPQFFVGVGTYGLSRPDVGAYIGSSQFNNSGYTITINSSNVPSPGLYDFYVFAHSTVTGTFPIARIVRVNVS
jgi:subtilisin family serine protease